MSSQQNDFILQNFFKILYDINENFYCKDSGATPAPPTTKPSIQGSFRIQHYSKKCFNFDSANQRIQLSSVCDDLYYLSSTKSLVHFSTGKCVRPSSNSDNSYIVLSANCDDNTKFELTSFGSLRQIKTGSCVHPLNGALYPKEGQPVVIYRGCDVDRLKFSFGNDFNSYCSSRNPKQQFHQTKNSIIDDSL